MARYPLTPMIVSTWMAPYVRRALLCAAVAGAGCAPAGTPPHLLIRNVTIVSPEREAPYGPAEDPVTEGRITAIGDALPTRGLPPDRIVDGTGQFLMPGLIDSHVHLSTIPGMHGGHEAEFPEIAARARAQLPRSYLYSGFTSVVDLISNAEAIATWNSQDVRPHAYFATGAPIADGYPTQRIPKPERYRAVPTFLFDPTRPEQFPADLNRGDHTPRAVVDRIAADGARAVKTFHEDGFGAKRDIPVPPREVLAALVAAARERGLPVLLHANSTSAQAAGVESGVAAIVHGLWTWDAPDAPELTAPVRAVLDGVIAKGIAYQPTIQVLYGERDLFDPDFLSRTDVSAVVPADVLAWYGSEAGQWLTREMRDVPPVAALAAAGRWQEIDAEPIRHVQQALAYMAARGGRLLFGSDTPSAPTYANPAGLNGRLEMNHWVAAGVSPRALLRAATLDNAEFFGLADEIGTVAVGRRADLLLMQSNPYESVAAYDAITLVILAGRVLPRASLAAGAR